MVSSRLPLSGLATAFAALKVGEGIRNVITYEEIQP
jgi:hypothetical protein